MQIQRKLYYGLLVATGVAFLVFAVWIIHEANIGRDNILFKTVRATPYGDKIGHILLAGFLTLVINFFLRHRALRTWGIIIPWGSIIVFAIAVVEEGSQFFLPTRSLDLKDGIANLIGILIFSIPSILIRRKADSASS